MRQGRKRPRRGTTRDVPKETSLARPKATSYGGSMTAFKQEHFFPAVPRRSFPAQKKKEKEDCSSLH